jgi:hypothetical protein
MTNHLNFVLLVYSTVQTLESNSVQHAKEFQDNLQFIDTLLGSLLEQAPNPNEAQASIAFFKAVQAALLRLADRMVFSPLDSLCRFLKSFLH